MKKSLVALGLIGSMLLAGCGPDKNATYASFSTLPNGDSVITDIQGNTYFPDQLPFQLKYNDHEISLTNVKDYQVEGDYSYTLFLVITMDVSQLNDKEIHWLRNEDLDVSAYMTHEKNQYDFHAMTMLGSLLYEDTKAIDFVLISDPLKDNRNAFYDADISVSIRATQEDTYKHKSSDGETHDLNRTESINYDYNTMTNITDAEDIPDPLYKYVSKWLREKADSYK